MVALSEVTRVIRIKGESQGLDDVAAKARTAGVAADGLGVAVERSAKSQLSAQRATDALRRSLDVSYRMEESLAKAENTLTRARDQGIISLTEETRLLGLAKLKYTEVAEESVLMAKGMELGTEAAHGLIAALGPIAAIAALAELPTKIMETVKAGAELSATAETIGLTAENLQKLDYAAKLNDVSTETMNSALTKFSKNLGEAETGTGKLADILKANHIVISGDVTRDFESYMSLLSRTTSQEQKNYLSTTAFGKSAEELGRLAKLGGEGIARLGEDAEATGQILGEDTLRQAEDLNKEFVKMQGQLGTAFETFMISIAPALEGAMWAITTSIRAANTALADWQYAKQLSLPEDQQSVEFLRKQLEVLKLQKPTLAIATPSMTLDANPMAADPGNRHSRAVAAQLAPTQQSVQDQIDHINEVLAQHYRDHPPTGGAFIGGWGSDALKGPPAKTPDAAAEAAAAAAAKLQKSYDELTHSASDFVDKQNLAVETYGMSADAAARLTHEQDLLSKATKDGIDLDSMAADGIHSKRQELISLADGMADAEVRTKQYLATMNALSDTLASMFSKPITDAQQFFDTVLGGFGSLGQANLKAGLQSLLSGHAFDATSGGSQGAGGSAGGLVPGVSQILDHLPDKVGAGVEGGLAQFMKDNAKTIGSAAGGLGIGYQTQNPLMGALGGALGGLASGDPIQAVVGGIAGFIGGLIGMNEALEKARKTLDDNRASIDQFIATGLGKTLDADTVALAQFKAQGAQLVQVAQAAGDAQLVANLNAAMDAYKDTLAASHVQDQIDQNRKDLIDSYHDQVSALQSVIDANRSFIDSMEQFRDSLKLDKSFSPLSPEAMLEESQRQFNLLLSKARLGDASAQGQLQGAASSYLGAAQGYLGSSDRYVGIFNQVEDALGQVVDTAQTRIDGTEAQLEATNQSLQILGDIHSTALDQVTEMRTIGQLIAAVGQTASADSANLQSQVADLTRAINNANLRRAS